MKRLLMAAFEPVMFSRILAYSFIAWCVLWLLLPSYFGVPALRERWGIPRDGVFSK